MGCRGRFRYALARYSAHAWLLLVLPDLVRTSVLSPTHEHHHQLPWAHCPGRASTLLVNRSAMRVRLS